MRSSSATSGAAVGVVAVVGGSVGGVAMRVVCVAVIGGGMTKGVLGVGVVCTWDSTSTGAAVRVAGLVGM